MIWRRLILWHQSITSTEEGLSQIRLCYKLMWAHQYCCPRSWRASCKPAVIARNTQLDAQPRATVSFIRVHKPQVSFSYSRDVQSIAQREMTRRGQWWQASGPALPPLSQLFWRPRRPFSCTLPPSLRSRSSSSHCAARMTERGLIDHDGP